MDYKLRILICRTSPFFDANEASPFGLTGRVSLRVSGRTGLVYSHADNALGSICSECSFSACYFCVLLLRALSLRAPSLRVASLH